MRKYLLIMILLLSTIGLASCAQRNPETSSDEIVIGIAGPLTGPSAEFGQMKVKAAQLAIDEINSAGGINGRRLRLISVDDAGDPARAYTVAEELAGNPQVLAVVGHWNSACTLEARFVYNGAGLPVITDSVNKKITDGNSPYIFRISLTDSEQAKVLAGYAYNRLGSRKVAVYYSNNAFGQGLKEDFINSFERLGGEITDVETYFENQTVDFSSELGKTAASAPDLIFIAGYYTETALIARQSREMGISTPILGTEGTSSAKLIELGGKAVEGIRFAGFFYAENPRGGSEIFVKNFEDRYQQKPDTYAALAYDSLGILARALAAEGTSRDGIYRYLSDMPEYQGVTGNISFDDQHNAHSSILILTVRNGEIVLDDMQP